MPKPLVVDASFAFRLLVPGPQQDLFRSLVAQWLRDGYELYAPTLWLYEITSALCKVVRFRELTPEEGVGHTFRHSQSRHCLPLRLTPVSPLPRTQPSGSDHALEALAFVPRDVRIA